MLFSHGLGGNREGSAYLGNHWAARGYVAVFLQHPGSDDGVWKNQPLRERNRAMRDAASGPNFLLRVKDVPAVLDQLDPGIGHGPLPDPLAGLVGAGIVHHEDPVDAARHPLQGIPEVIHRPIDLGHALRFPEVRVAILAATETINPKMPSTVEAGALCKMADRGQITGGILDGPLALDNAISLESVKIKKIDSPVAGRANVLVVPDLEAGNMLAKQLSFLANADSAGLVLGARVPAVLTSRADSVRARLASVAVAVRLAHARRSGAGVPA